MRRLVAAFLLLLGLAAPASAQYAEGIDNFASDVTVNADASLTVHESIAVSVDNIMINHGIERDFPTDYPDQHGQTVRVGFEVLDVKRDGHDEPYSVSSYGNGKRVRIGDKDVIVDRGPHTYEITYRTTRQLGFFKNYDELYWNVTGNGWDFFIDKASVTIRLPPGATIVKSSAYTGYAGEKGADFQVTSASGDTYRAETTRSLKRNEGLTVAVAWPKGFVAEPTQNDRLRWWIGDNAGYFGLALTLLAVFAYYLYGWNKVGRDPPKGTIIPLFKPPEGLGPAATRYVLKQGYDDRGFAAGLVGLAVKGGVKISEDASGVYSITKAGGAKAALTGVEQALFAAMPSGTTVLKQTNHVRMQAMKQALQKALAATYDGVAFLRNLGWFFKGAAISAVGLIGSALLLPTEQGLPALMIAAWSSIWWGVILTVGWGALRGLGASRGVLGKIGALFPLLFLVPFVGAGVIAPTVMFVSSGSPGMYAVAGAAILLGVMAVVFFHLLRAPTVAGRRLLDQIEGFRMYMVTAEEDRLNILNPPEKTPELFERYLPYAMALDCENEWNAKFAAVLAAAAAAGAAAPLWYSGNHWNSGSFGSDLGSSLASSIASSSTAPGSSSGSSGGGSSGGGGGGGGGGGW
jgi:uncharacterized membrane protein YgcG